MAFLMRELMFAHYAQVWEAMQRLLDAEDKARPWSDRRIAEQLSKQGMPCHEWTILKLRREHHIPASHKRKQLASKA